MNAHCKFCLFDYRPQAGQVIAENVLDILDLSSTKFDYSSLSVKIYR